MNNRILVYIPSDSKAAPHISMENLLGVPQFLRGILALQSKGLNEVVLIAPHTERRQIIKSWNKHIKNREIIPHFIWTAHNQKINSNIFNDILDHMPESISILNANLLLTSNVLSQWENATLKKGEHLKAVIDRGLPPLIQIKRADISKFKNTLNKSSLRFEDILKLVLNNTSAHKLSKKWNQPVLLFTRFTKKSEAIHFLTEQIRKNTPAWIARNINKRISLPVSIVLAKLRVSPNTITAFNMLIGMGASIGVAGRTYVGLLIGAILFQLASIVDGCDGEVAKLTHRCTKFGQYIDSISDNFALAGFFTGLMIHEYRVSNHSPAAFIWGGLLLLGFFTLLSIMINFLKKNTDSASFVTFDKEYLAKLPETYPKPILLFIKYGKYTLKKDFFSFLFLIFAILGILPVMFYVAIIGIWIGIIVLFYLNFKTIKQRVKIHKPISIMEKNYEK